MRTEFDQPALTARLDAAVGRAILERRVVGAVILVAKDGKVVHRKAAGLADSEAGRVMREDAIFRLASVTKPFVAAAALRLVELGHLSETDPVTRWLPDFRPRLQDGSQPLIILHNLLTHTSGLSYRFLEPAGSPYHALNVSDGMDQPGLTIAENLARLAAAPLSFAPGESWRYSLAMDVLGAVMEAATGETLDRVVAKYVTEPLKMKDTSFHTAPNPRLAKPYADGKPAPVPMTDGMAVPIYDSAAIFAPSRALDAGSYPSGGAGMVGTADDLMVFLEAVRCGGGPILQPETLGKMLKDQVGSQAQTQGEGWGFGYGWAVLVDPSATGTPQAQGTIQWGGAYGHTWFVDRANGLSVVMMTNTAFEGVTGAFPGEIRDAVYGV